MKSYNRFILIAGTIGLSIVPLYTALVIGNSKISPFDHALFVTAASAVIVAMIAISVGIFQLQMADEMLNESKKQTRILLYGAQAVIEDSGSPEPPELTTRKWRITELIAAFRWHGGDPPIR